MEVAGRKSSRAELAYPRAQRRVFFGCRASLPVLPTLPCPASMRLTARSRKSLLLFHKDDRWSWHRKNLTGLPTEEGKREKNVIVLDFKTRGMGTKPYPEIRSILIEN